MTPPLDSIFDAVGLPAADVQDSPDARQVLLSGFRPRQPEASRAEQTRDVFEQMEQALREMGCDFSHVVRTWFFLDDILAWYDQFNAARTTFFEARHVFDGLVPASTGVGVAGLDAALTAAVLAVKPRGGRAQVGVVESPLQCPALDYRSSFSRAVEIGTPASRALYISGTASIDNEGRTAYVGDVDRQIELTLAVVDALLASRAMDWAHVTRAVGYFPDLRHAPQLKPHLVSLGMNPDALRIVEATICRSDLLFELELDAVVPTAGGG